jgi:hypothetical protein
VGFKFKLVIKGLFSNELSKVTEITVNFLVRVSLFMTLGKETMLLEI